MIFGFVCEIVAVMTIVGFAIADLRSTSVRYTPIFHQPIHVYDSIADLFGNAVTNEIMAGFYICVDLGGPSLYHSYGIWLPIIVYDGILFLLALWKSVSSWISGDRARQINGARITDALVKGNASYFFRYARSP